MAPLAASLARIAPETSEPAEDRAPDDLAAGTPQPLRSDLIELVGADRVLTRASDLIRYASDASPYRLFPKAVVMARDVGDVARVLEYARKEGVSVTLRAGGTSLNGQAQGEGIIVDVRRHWRGIAPEQDGAQVRVKPGSVLGDVNRVLAPLGRKLGPDPASTDIACVGGVIANNSGGMRCGVVRDSYQTVRELTFVLPSGAEIDTGAPGAADQFAEEAPELAAGLSEIRDEIRADETLTERIRRKFEIKNTTGYRLCAFLDADEPLEIFRRLLVGSEGTLAFVAEAVFETVRLEPHTTLSWIHFDSIDAACEPVPDLVAAGASAVELMVAPALMVAANSIPGTPEYWKELPPESAALLVEFRSDDPADLDGLEAKAAEVLAERKPFRGPEFTREPEVTELYWRVREGLHGLIGKLRPEGTALIIEDVCVPPAQIAAAAKDIQALLGENGFLTGVAGHTSAGNLHFMLTPKFDEASERERYEKFMSGLVELILDRYDGSLKAEHGTGLNMAPFVEREWGKKATEMMWRVKALADPDGVLGPGVVLNRDPSVHLRNLKSTPPIEEEATSCVECGFCEPVCPSRDLTTTPRQRIVIRREMARQSPGSPVSAALLREYEYDALQTCAADGSCELACPLGIDTGKLVKDLRERQHPESAERRALKVAQRWGRVEKAARRSLRIGNAVSRAVGSWPMRGLTGALRAAADAELVPAWRAPMPPAAPRSLPATTRDGAAAVYFPACINRIFGPPRGNGDTHERSLPKAMVAVSQRAGLPVWIPDDVSGHCCATPWTSKGYRGGAELVANRLVERLWHWSGHGNLPVVIDASSCTLGVGEVGAFDGDDKEASLLSAENRERHGDLEIVDSIAWAHDRLLPRLEVSEKVGSATVHPTCSTRHLGLSAKLAGTAESLAEEVHVPFESNCCGFAGDRGFLHPELTESATTPLADELDGRNFGAHLSSNRTCEIGLERATGRPYASFIHLLEERTR